MKRFLLSSGKTNRMEEAEHVGDLDRHVRQFVHDTPQAVMISLLAWEGFKISRGDWSIEPFDGGVDE